MLQVFNSLPGRIEPFTPISQDKKVTMYVCGITPYDTTHLGHAFTYISFDVLVRYIKYLGFEATYTQNVTDINDRDNDLLKKAKEQEIAWEDLAQFWTKKFLQDMENLNWSPPTNYLYASDEITAMTTLTQQIIRNGFGYVVNGSVYLDVSKVSDFGKLSKLTQEQMLVRAKEFEEDVDNPDKKNKLDITLWRERLPSQPPHIPSFESPWGMGRPGWHVECSSMAIESLGEQIDIHGGGIDLIYPHHESEIAQSESATGKKPFAKYWMHTGTVGINGQKMSKSLGNLVLISDLLKKYSANAVRWVLLSHHYRESWQYEEQEFVDAEKSVNEITHALSQSFEKETGHTSVLREAVQEDLDNDLQTPDVLTKFTDAADQIVATKNLPLQSQLRELFTMIGFTL